MRFACLHDWLRWQQSLHPRSVDLGLERVRTVAALAGLGTPPMRIVSIAGTNGKGACAMLLEAVLERIGVRTGTFTSPHLLRYAERIRIAGREVDDAEVTEAFAAIDAARADVSLTYFEWSALAAMHLFCEREVEVALLEVGLGGRLDAVNLWDPEVALITTVGLDHRDWLGADRESIAAEKAGILRADRAAVYGARDLPQAVASRARALGVDLRVLGRDFDLDCAPQARADTWTWRGRGARLQALPPPVTPGAHQMENAAAAIQVLELLGVPLAARREALDRGLVSARLPGRFERLAGPPECWLDVAHNVQAAEALARTLAARPTSGRTLAVIAMFADKDVEGVVEAMREAVDVWFAASLEPPRGAPAERVRDAVLAAGGELGASLALVEEAYEAAVAHAGAADRIVVFGSFHTVGAIVARSAGQSRDPSERSTAAGPLGGASEPLAVP